MVGWIHQDFLHLKETLHVKWDWLLFTAQLSNERLNWFVEAITPYIV
jgi:hypothetical protein